MHFNEANQSFAVQMTGEHPITSLKYPIASFFAPDYNVVGSIDVCELHANG